MKIKGRDTMGGKVLTEVKVGDVGHEECKRRTRQHLGYMRSHIKAYYVISSHNLFLSLNRGTIYELAM